MRSRRDRPHAKEAVVVLEAGCAGGRREGGAPAREWARGSAAACRRCSKEAAPEEGGACSEEAASEEGGAREAGRSSCEAHGRDRVRVVE